ALAQQRQQAVRRLQAKLGHSPPSAVQGAVSYHRATMATVVNASRCALIFAAGAAGLLGACASAPKKEEKPAVAAPPKPNAFKACRTRKSGEQEVLDEASS